MKYIVLVSMIFCHIVDDYYLQGILAQMKQREWWKTHAPDSLYKHDYIIALIEHAFSWTCSIFLPILIYTCFTKSYRPEIVYILTFIFNLVIHAIVDHMKANLKIINLIHDQILHVIQIIITWGIIILT